MTSRYTAFTLVLFPCFFSPLLHAQRKCCEGDIWVRWSEQHREDYVKAYILGEARGFSDACNRISKYWPEKVTLGGDNPISKCLKEMPDFSRGSEYFARKTTEFYGTYPQGRILLITEVLDALGRGKSIESINEEPPFPVPGHRLK